MYTIGILGAGTWGVALAQMLAKIDQDVTVWSALPQEIDALQETHTHPHLPGCDLPESIHFTKELKDACKEKDIILFAVPSVFVRSTAKAAAPFIPDGQIIVDVGKGIEADSMLFLSEVIRDELKKTGNHDGVKVVALSGPTHAEEVAVDLPTTIVSACEDEGAAEFVQDVFMNTCLRVYTNTDSRGVELCGAMKNIIALAAGISAGLGYGDNAKAAIITRGMTEITRLGLAMNCNQETFFGLAGIGDLVVTATSRHSRNNKAGFLIGQGKSVEEAKNEVGMVVEGINAIPAAMALSKKYGVELPITEAVDRVINHGGSPKEEVQKLMEREKKTELIHG